jgi:hypothetical protein
MGVSAIRRCQTRLSDSCVARPLTLPARRNASLIWQQRNTQSVFGGTFAGRICFARTSNAPGSVWLASYADQGYPIAAEFRSSPSKTSWRNVKNKTRTVKPPATIATLFAISSSRNRSKIDEPAQRPLCADIVEKRFEAGLCATLIPSLGSARAPMIQTPRITNSKISLHWYVREFFNKIRQKWPFVRQSSDARQFGLGTTRIAGTRSAAEQSDDKQVLQNQCDRKT